MREEEAKTKWCPHARVASDHAYCGSYNRVNNGSTAGTIGTPSIGAKCIGSACMMWRWKMVRDPVHGVAQGKSSVDGHCGLAGNP